MVWSKTYLNHSLNPSLPTSRPDLVSIVSHLLFVSPEPRPGGRRARAAPHQTAWLCRVHSPPVTSSLHIQDAGWKWGKWICCPLPPPGRDIRNSETRLVLAIFLPSEWNLLFLFDKSSHVMWPFVRQTLLPQCSQLVPHSPSLSFTLRSPNFTLMFN